jgi:hypothetical protein
MALRIQSQDINIDSLHQSLAAAFPDLQVKILNKSTVVIIKGKIMCVVRIRKNGLKIQGDLNTKNPLNITLIALGIILGVIGVFLIFGILYLIYLKAIKELRNKVYFVLGGASNV